MMFKLKDSWAPVAPERRLCTCGLKKGELFLAHGPIGEKVIFRRAKVAKSEIVFSHEMLARRINSLESPRDYVGIQTVDTEKSHAADAANHAAS